MSPLPVLSAEARSEALRKAAAIRKERGDLLAELTGGRISLKEILDRKDDVVGRTRVKSLLEALPGVGKIRAMQLLNEISVSERRRVQGLGVRQTEKLVNLFPHQR